MQKIFYIYLFICISTPIFGQISMGKGVAESDYDQWGKLENRSLSPKGNWVSYKMYYDNSADTLFLRSTHNNKVYLFTNGEQEKFGGETAFGVMNGRTELSVVILDKDKVFKMADIVSYDFANSGETLVTYSVNGALIIRDKQNKEITTIPGVLAYHVDENTNSLRYVMKSGHRFVFGFFDLKSFENHPCYSSDHKLYELTKAEYGKGSFFLEEGGDFSETTLHYFYDWKNPGLIFNPKSFAGFPKEHGIISSKGFKISKDGKRIFFGIGKAAADAAAKDAVEVWDSDDLWVYPKEKLVNIKNYSRLAVWFPEEHRFLQVTDSSLPFVQLNGSRSVALLYNPTAYAPYFKRYGEVDYYLFNLVDGSKFLFLEKQPEEKHLISFSPDGNYICYFRDQNWWMYSIAKQTSYCIKAPPGVQWASNDLKYGARPNIFGIRAWSTNGLLVYLEDEFDIYQFHAETKELLRLTNGRESNTNYTLDPSSTKFLENSNYNGNSTFVLKTDNGLVCLARDGDSKVQYLTLFKNSTTGERILGGHTKADQVLHANGVYVYREQSYTMSPRIVFLKHNVKKVLFQSNAQLEKYDRGKVELISFFNSNGVKLQGLLYYPIHYDSSKLYPLLVDVYSQVSNGLHDYITPSLYNSTGFNIRHFVFRDYFVLLPDIVYKEGETGKSALDCVEQAVNYVIARGLADSNKVGLSGHSFGGYETNFIITQTNRFKAAVSGAGITDIISWYFSNSKSLHIPEYWRSETQQWRMGKSFFDDKELYLRNSPILYADQVTTPLLSWAGKMEVNLPYEQSILFYNALRRAGKKNVLLLYPRDNHVIEIKQNQLDLSKRISNWFDHYLK